MNPHSEPTPQTTLEHFLKFALTQLGVRLKKIPVGASETRRMRLLEELIKEQLPDENPDSATGASR